MPDDLKELISTLMSAVFSQGMAAQRREDADHDMNTSGVAIAEAYNALESHFTPEGKVQ